MDFDLYHCVKNIEKELKADSNIPDFQVSLSTEEDEKINFIIMNKFVIAQPNLPDNILNTYINKLKESGYNYEHSFIYPNTIQISSALEGAPIINESTQNHYTLKRIKG